MHTLNVALGERAYLIHVGAGLIAQPDLIRAAVKGKRAAVVSNETVAPLYMDALLASLSSVGIEAVPIVLPDGEAYKDWQTLNLIHTALLEMRAERSTTLFALGGGVVGDMTGFAASTYQRGMPFIQLPTTLLSQVDSSVGGKTAINHPLGKNMIGAFYQPKLVLADVSTLSTLPDRELKAGLAEVIKHGLIRDYALFEWLEQNIDALLAKDSEALAWAVHRNCSIKAAVVVADETEQGERALLNFGHTFGHAIETGMGYGAWLHGEAVAAGMVMAGQLSVRLGMLAEADFERLLRLIERAGLPVAGPAMGAERYIELMQHDKKVQDGQLRLVLLSGLGRACIYAEANPVDIAAAIEARCATAV